MKYNLICANCAEETERLDEGGYCEFCRDEEKAPYDPTREEEHYNNLKAFSRMLREQQKHEGR